MHVSACFIYIERISIELSVSAGRNLSSTGFLLLGEVYSIRVCGTMAGRHSCIQHSGSMVAISKALVNDEGNIADHTTALFKCLRRRGLVQVGHEQRSVTVRQELDPIWQASGRPLRPALPAEPQHSACRTCRYNKTLTVARPSGRISAFSRSVHSTVRVNRYVCLHIITSSP